MKPCSVIMLSFRLSFYQFLDKMYSEQIIIFQLYHKYDKYLIQIMAKFILCLVYILSKSILHYVLDFIQLKICFNMFCREY